MSIPSSGSLHEFLQCGSFAVAGVSSNEQKFGTMAYRDLKAAGKKVFGINPRLKDLGGETIYPDVAALPESPDVLVLVVNAAIGLTLVEQAAQRGIKRVWMQPGAESDALLQRCAELGLQAVHNQCVMRQLGNR